MHKYVKRTNEPLNRYNAKTFGRPVYFHNCYCLVQEIHKIREKTNKNFSYLRLVMIYFCKNPSHNELEIQENHS